MHNTVKIDKKREYNFELLAKLKNVMKKKKPETK